MPLPTAVRPTDTVRLFSGGWYQPAASRQKNLVPFRQYCFFIRKKNNNLSFAASHSLFIMNEATTDNEDEGRKGEEKEVEREGGKGEEKEVERNDQQRLEQPAASIAAAAIAREAAMEKFEAARAKAEKAAMEKTASAKFEENFVRSFFMREVDGSVMASLRDER